VKLCGLWLLAIATCISSLWGQQQKDIHMFNSRTVTGSTVSGVARRLGIRSMPFSVPGNNPRSTGPSI
jgi:hypothetical protein